MTDNVIPHTLGSNWQHDYVIQHLPGSNWFHHTWNKLIAEQQGFATMIWIPPLPHHSFSFAPSSAKEGGTACLLMPFSLMKPIHLCPPSPTTDHAIHTSMRANLKTSAMIAPIRKRDHVTWHRDHASRTYAWSHSITSRQCTHHQRIELCFCT